MKRKAAKTKRAGGTAHPGPAGKTSARGNVPRWRAGLFRLLAVVLVPLGLLAIAELALRLFGYGYPTSYLIPATVNGKEALVDNDRFGFRFFPPAMARTPPPTVLTERKATNTVRIFLFGESAALGDPKPAYGVSRYLEVLLRERYPQARFEVIPAAITAINSHVLRLMARELAGLNADLWIVYAGNNEMVGPFGAGTVFGPKAPSLAWVRASLALKSTRLGEVLNALLTRLGGAGAPAGTWGGMEMFVENKVPPGDPRKETVYRSFQANLEDIVRAGLDAKAQVILSTVASNLKDCAPFASAEPTGLSDAELEAWKKLRKDLLGALVRQNFAEARRLSLEALKSATNCAELYYELGAADLGLTNRAEAAQSLILARDLDALPFRADSRLNRIIAEVASHHAAEGVRLVDAEAALGPAAATGIPGEESFYEHVHLNFAGNYRLARAFANAVAPALPAWIRQGAQAQWAGEARCAQDLGLTDWNRAAAEEAMLLRLGDAPFTNRINNGACIAHLRRELAATRQGLRAESVAETRQRYQAACAAAPDDFHLREGFAEFLEATGDQASAYKVWEELRQLLPQHLGPAYQLARLAIRLGRPDDAEGLLRQVLKRRPDFSDARVELGRALFKQGRLDEARVEFAAVLKQQPDHARVRLYLADVLAAQNHRPEALAELRDAARLRPNFWEARYLLGVELAMTNEVEAARAEFEAATQLRPDFALGHLNLGVALARLGLYQKASTEFQETLRLDPQNQKARQQLDFIASLKQPEK